MTGDGRRSHAPPSAPDAGARPTPEPAGATPGPRRALRAVAVPAEHGGWALTLEPAALGLLVAPSAAGWCLAVGALVAFVARTPLKVVLVDRRRHRTLHRTGVAAGVLGGELAVQVGLVVAAVQLSSHPFWWPLAGAAPLVGLELWFDMRSRSRRLAPELAGAVGVSAVVAMVALAGGTSARLALALWLIVAARVVTSIPFVRARIAAMHHRDSSSGLLVAADVAALVLAVAGVAMDRSVVVGAVAIVGLVAFQRVASRQPPPRVGIIGVQQVVVGLVVVVATAVGVHRW